MIRVTLRRTGSGLYAGYEITGHAGWAEKGHDIVCAAASFLGITCANALERAAGVKTENKTGDGYVSVRFPAESGEKAQTVMQVLRQGFLDLADTYPDYVKLNETTIMEE